MLLVPARQYLMPRMFHPEHLRELDTAEYEEVPAIEPEEALKVTRIICSFVTLWVFRQPSWLESLRKRKCVRSWIKKSLGQQ